MSQQDSQEDSRSKRWRHCGVIVAAIVLTLWFTLRRETAPPAHAEAEISATEDVVGQEPEATDDRPVMEAPALPSPASDTFAVYLQPLQYDTTVAQALAKVDEYYAEFAYRLRAVPGLLLVNDQVTADFRVTISGLDSAGAQSPLPTPEWTAKTSVEVLNGELRPLDPAGTTYVLGMVGDAWRDRAPASVNTRGPLTGGCEKPTIMPCSPAAIAERQVMALRKKVFPRDGSLQRELEARVLNAALDMRERNMAISDLLSMKVAPSAEMIREILLRINRASDDLDRGNLLALLEGQRRQEAIQPLIDVAKHDLIGSLRIQAVKLLATDFPDNASVRSALDTIASDAVDPAVQIAAKEAIAGLPKN